jgi:ABC-type nitrate/sulfonate/bicarbonate transport system substrate-binding protein
MSISRWVHSLAGLTAAMLAILPSLPAAHAEEPVTIRIGYGPAAEEQLWLMAAKPDVTPNQGKAYKLDMTIFRGSAPRFKAFEGGQLDAATTSANAALLAASKGIPLKILASISRESSKGFTTKYLVAADSKIATIADLRGKTIGINGYRSSIEIWARAALIEAGLNPDRDVKWAVVPFPAMGEAIRTGKVDVAGVPQPFAALEEHQGGLRILFDSKTGIPFDEELQVLIFQPDFLKKHPDAVRAFLADFVAATQFYGQHRHEAQQALLDAKFVQLDPAVLFAMQDNYRAPDGRPSIDLLRQMQDLMLKMKFQDEPAKLDEIVDLSFFPPQK